MAVLIRQSSRADRLPSLAQTGIQATVFPKQRNCLNSEEHISCPLAGLSNLSSLVPTKMAGGVGGNFTVFEIWL